MPNIAVEHYFKQFVPVQSVKLYRFERVDHDDTKRQMADPHILPIQSWTHNKELAQGVASSLNECGDQGQYVVREKVFQPTDIYTDFSLFPHALQSELTKQGGESEMSEVLVYHIPDTSYHSPKSNSFEGHQGRPGQRGGSVARDVASDDSARPEGPIYLTPARKNLLGRLKTDLTTSLFSLYGSHPQADIAEKYGPELAVMGLTKGISAQDVWHVRQRLYHEAQEQLKRAAIPPESVLVVEAAPVTKDPNSRLQPVRIAAPLGTCILKEGRHFVTAGKIVGYDGQQYFAEIKSLRRQYDAPPEVPKPVKPIIPVPVNPVPPVVVSVKPTTQYPPPPITVTHHGGQWKPVDGNSEAGDGVGGRSSLRRAFMRQFSEMGLGYFRSLSLIEIGKRRAWVYDHQHSIKVVNMLGEQQSRMETECPALAKIGQSVKRYDLIVEPERVLNQGNHTMGRFSPGMERIQIAAKAGDLDEMAPRFGGGRFHPSNDLTFTFRHEFGHFVYYNMHTIGVTSYEWKSLYQSMGQNRMADQVSRYSRKNDREGFAEAFAAYTSTWYGAAGRLPKPVEAFFERYFPMNRKSKMEGV